MCLDIPNLEQRRLAHGKMLGYEYEIVHNGMGERCGYLRVVVGHQWFHDREAIDEIRVHGGVTYVGRGKPCATHGPHAELWIGFDCGHWGDAKDPALLDAAHREIYDQYPDLLRGGTVRTQDYVLQQIRKMARQAQKASAE